MELQYLAYFMEVAKTEHISQAASTLHITQPALSRAITRVEEVVGAPLFDRGPNSIRLNHAGRLLLPRVERILAEYDDALREIADISGADTGAVKLVAPIQELLRDFLRSYLPAHPNMQIFYQIVGADDLNQMLISHGADFAVFPRPRNSVYVTWEPLFREEYRLAVPADHPLAVREEARLEDFAQERFICTHGSSVFLTLLRDFCWRAGFEPKFSFLGDDVDFALELVARHLGIIFVPVSMLDPRRNPDLDKYREQVRFLRLPKNDCFRVIGLAKLKKGYMTASAAKTMQAVRNYFAGFSDIDGFTIFPEGTTSAAAPPADEP